MAMKKDPLISDAQRAQVLVDALPYIQKYRDKAVVIKFGGHAMGDDRLEADVMRDVMLLSFIGIRVVLVHGGGPEITDMLKKMGMASRFVDGLRYTDSATMEVVQMVLAGKLNKGLVARLQSMGAHAMGLCGIDDSMIRARKKMTPDLGQVGEIVDINPAPILHAFDAGTIPVVATVGIGEDGSSYNINADTAAAKIAAHLNAENLILMTDVKGLLRDKEDPSTLIPSVNVSEVPLLVKQGVISGGMIPKVECCVEAVRRGVKRSFIIDGRIPHAILIEMLSSEGIGTMFY